MSAIEELREKAYRLPLEPGVYIMKDAVGEVIYVGKAKALKNRVTSYFRGEHLPKVAAMVSHVNDFDVIVVGSEFEALVLENSLIKRHKPHYNILLRDDKGYPFIRLDRTVAYPKMEIVGRLGSDGADYYGPFPGRTTVKEFIDTVSKALGLPTCGRSFPRDVGKQRPCLNLHLGACRGWCLKDADPDEYRRLMDEAVMVLEGRTEELISALEQRMLQASDDMRFELAAAFRDRIRALQSMKTRQRIIGAAAADTDAVAFYRGARCCFTVLHYVDGDLTSKDYELMDEPLETDAEAISGLLREYYSERGAWPRTILLPCDIDDADTLSQLLSQQAGRRVYIETPKRGDRLRLVEDAVRNAEVESQRAATAAQKRLKTLEWLQKTLSLPELPERIEAFDVSNLGNFGIVAAMTVFVRGRPLKRDYRKFRMKETDSQDDYASMSEAVMRRFRRLMENDPGFSSKPDLLLIDGGAQHAAAALAVLRELELDVPVFGMVKDDRHRTRALVSPLGEETGISGNPAVFALIGGIQEETHRFAIEYQRSLRNENITSELDKIKGVGEKRRNELLKAFKTVKAIRSAGMDELSAVVPINTARAVYEYFHAAREPGDDE